MPEKITTLPYPLAVEKPQETKSQSRAERYWHRAVRVAAPVVGALALAGATPERPIENTDSPVASPLAASTYGVEAMTSTETIRLAAAPIPRSTEDKPDEVSGPQVHPIYVVPADGVDRQLDTNGNLENVIWKSQDWLANAAEGLSLRMDTYQGRMDISFYRSAQSSDSLYQKGPFVVDSVREELWAAGFEKGNNKVLLVLYDGQMQYKGYDLCGVADWPPKVPGNTAIVGMSEYCDSRFVTPRRAGIPHEVFHATGQVPDSAPSSDGSAHSTDPRDIMTYTGITSQNFDSLMVDPEHDDYWNNVLPRLTRNHSNLKLKARGPGKISFLGQEACQKSCDYEMRAGDNANLLAKPAKRARFVKWIGGCASKPRCNVTIKGGQNRSLTAIFAKKAG